MSLKVLSQVRRAIGFRLTVWYSVLFILSALLLFSLGYALLHSSLRHKDQENIAHELQELVALYHDSGIEGVTREIELQQKLHQAQPFFIRMADPQHTTHFIIIPDQWAAFDLKPLEDMAATAAIEWIDVPAADDPKRLEVASLGLSDGSLLQVGKSTEDRRDVLERFRGMFGGVIFLGIILGFAGGWILAFRTLRPIRHLIHTVKSIEAGTIDARVPTRGTGDELDELGRLFNDMLDKIAILIQGMRGALDTVAHDLRTPLARIRGIAEIALRAEQDPEAYREALADCVDESDRLLTMLNTLMDISEAETGALKLELEAVNISALIEEAVDLYAYVAEEKEIAVATIAPRDLCLTADRNRIRQVLTNLLDNAIKYTPPGGRIDFIAYQEQVVMVIEDTGVGMSPQELPKIWDRLYRGDHSRSHRGLGLGLSLVKAVVQAHKGAVDVASVPGAGSRFTLVLPGLPPAST